MGRARRQIRSVTPKRSWLALALATILLGLAPQAGRAAIETEAKQVIMVEDATGAILLEKSSGETMFPASMSKLMTLYLLFGRLAEGSLTLDDTMTVSEKAWRMGGSKMFVEVNARVAVRDLLLGISVHSGNDACIVVAEGIAGSEEAFAGLMNKQAQELGLTGSHFVNSTGWPHPDHITTARDLAVLAHRIIHDFPQFYPLLSEKSFTYNDITQGNRNPLLYRYSGSDGLKTGHTEASGYGLTASALRDDRRIILVINGLPSVNARAQEAERLLDYGFREFKNYALFKAGDVVDTIDVWLGDTPDVPLIIEDALTITMSRKARADLVVKIVAPGPVRAPIAKGDTVATLVVSAPEMAPIEVPLTAGADVDSLSGFGRIGAAINVLIWGEAN